MEENTIKMKLFDEQEENLPALLKIKRLGEYDQDIENVLGSLLTFWEEGSYEDMTYGANEGLCVVVPDKSLAGNALSTCIVSAVLEICEYANSVGMFVQFELPDGTQIGQFVGNIH